MTLKTRLSSFWANNNPFANILPERQQRRQKEQALSEKPEKTENNITKSSRLSIKKSKLSNLFSTFQDSDTKSISSENSNKSSNNGSSNLDQNSTIAFGLMSTMAVRPILEHVAPDTKLKDVDVALNEIKTTTSSVYGLTNDQIRMVEEVERFLPGHTFVQYIEILDKAKWSVEKAITPRTCKRLKPRDIQALSVSLNQWSSTFLDKVCDESANKASGGIATTSITSNHHKIARNGSIDSSVYNRE